MEIKSKEITLIAIGDIKPNEKNRNKHSDAQIVRLVEIIKYQGFRNPLIVSNRTGTLVAGHGRLLAARRLNLSQVPVIFQDFESEEQEYAASVSDNAVASWAELDLAGINADLGDLGPDFEITLLGLKEFGIVPEDKFEMEDELKEDMNKKFILEITFPNDMEMMDIHDDLVSRGYIVRIK